MKTWKDGDYFGHGDGDHVRVNPRHVGGGNGVGHCCRFENLRGVKGGDGKERRITKKRERCAAAVSQATKGIQGRSLALCGFPLPISFQPPFVIGLASLYFLFLLQWGGMMVIGAASSVGIGTENKHKFRKKKKEELKTPTEFRQECHNGKRKDLRRRGNSLARGGGGGVNEATLGRSSPMISSTDFVKSILLVVGEIGILLALLSSDVELELKFLTVSKNHFRCSSLLNMLPG